jgi:hypothetical protein
MPDTKAAHALIDAIARFAPELRCFGMDLARSRAQFTEGIETFKRLSRFKNLSSIVVCTNHAATLTNEDFQSIIDLFPGLEILSIQPSVIYSSTKPLATLEVLDRIARRCICIRSICLYLDVSKKRLPAHDTHLEQLPETLYDLDFGLSVCDDTSSTALQLIRMLGHSNPRIHSNSSPRFFQRYISDEAQYEAARMRWGEVASAISLLRRFIKSMDRVQTKSGGVSNTSVENGET